MKLPAPQFSLALPLHAMLHGASLVWLTAEDDIKLPHQHSTPYSTPEIVKFASRH